MNLHSLVVVLLRMFTLYYFLMGIIQVFASMAPFLPGIIKSSDFSFWEIAIPSLILIVFIIFGLVIWFFALPLAKLLTRNLPQELSLGRIDLENCYIVAFVIVGLYFAMSYFAETLNWCHFIFKQAASTSGDAWKQNVDFYKAAAAFIPFISGIIMVSKAKYWGTKLYKWHKKQESYVSEGNSADSQPPAS